jgi:SapC
VNVTIPPGYKSLVALDKQKHKGMGVVSQHRHAFALAITGIYVVAQEFVQAARHYPVVFAKDGTTGDILPIAVTGMTQNENLFIGDDGEWDKTAYTPAYVRRWPFLGVRVKEEKQTKNGNIVICVDENGLEPSDKPIFNEQGELNDVFTPIQNLIREMEGARQATEHLCSTLNELALLEPFEAHAFPKKGQEMRLRGMLRVNENKLNELQVKDIKRLMKHGELSRIYAHLMSLDNFKSLMERAAARQAEARLVS